MELVGKEVKHDKYGEGYITEQSDEYVYIKFNAQAEIKMFSYPTCFGTFLTLMDADAADYVKQLCKEKEKLKAEETVRRQNRATGRFVDEAFQDISSSVNGITVPMFNSVNEFYYKSKDAIDDEIKYLRTYRRKRYQIFDGKRIETGDKHYIYSFETDTELHLPDETLITLWFHQMSYRAYVIACEDYNIIFRTNENFGKYVPEMELSAEPWQLMEALIDRLGEINRFPSGIVKMLLFEGMKAIDTKGEIIRGQNFARHMAITQPITFVWGPPGTGKTETLAEIVCEHIGRGNRVLMLSYSNVSVDGAVSRVHDKFHESSPGILIRYGYPRDEKLLTNDYLTSFNLAIHRNPDLFREQLSLNEERKKVSITSPQRAKIAERLSQIRDKLKQEEKKIVSEAKFVATTVSKAEIDEAIYSQNFDVVIFDEASMAIIPQIVFAASLAKKHFICLGDFRQLPPIVQSSKTSFLNADIFQYCRISLAVDNGWKHNWMCMLDMQHRMHPDIADFISYHVYHSQLKSDELIERKLTKIVSNRPMEGAAMGLIDLSEMMSVCIKTHDYSRINVLSAFIACSLAIDAASSSDVGIITPYNAQSRLIHAMARDIEEYMPDLHPITCATVHQFQGSEKDIIIYDAVDCYRMKYPGMVLTSLNNDYANRLFNVAITRAKGKFIVIANVAYMNNKNLSKKLLFSKLINHLQSMDKYIQGKEICNPNSSNKERCLKYFEGESADQEFLRDIAGARMEIRIDIPGKINVSETFIENLCGILEKAKTNGIKTFIRAENKEQLPPLLRRISIENGFVANPLAVIDERVIWFGEPISADHFVSEGININTSYRPVIRFVGRYTAKALYGLLRLNDTVDQTIIDTIKTNDVYDNFASYVTSHKTCPNCGKPMKLLKNREGKFYLGCTAYPNCKTTELLEPDFVNEYLFKNFEDGVRCPQDGTPLEACLGPYGIYIKCYGKVKHIFRLDEI